MREVSDVLLRYNRLLRAVHQTFMKTTKISKTKKVEVVVSVDPTIEIAASKTRHRDIKCCCCG